MTEREKMKEALDWVETAAMYLKAALVLQKHGNRDEKNADYFTEARAAAVRCMLHAARLVE